MAKVEWSAGIDSVSGALSKPGKNGQHSCAKMLLGTHRTAATESKDCNRLYLRKKVERSTQPTSKELATRARFTAVAAAIKTRKADLMRVTEDEAMVLDGRRCCLRSGTPAQLSARRTYLSAGEKSPALFVMFMGKF